MGAKGMRVSWGCLAVGAVPAGRNVRGFVGGSVDGIGERAGVCAKAEKPRTIIAKGVRVWTGRAGVCGRERCRQGGACGGM